MNRNLKFNQTVVTDGERTIVVGVDVDGALDSATGVTIGAKDNGCVEADNCDSIDDVNSKKHSNGNEALDSEELEVLLKSQQQQRSSEDNNTSSDTELTQYNPQKRHQKSGFQLDSSNKTRGHQVELKTTKPTMNTSSNNTNNNNNNNGNQKQFTDPNGRTKTTSLTSPSLNLTSQHLQQHLYHQPVEPLQTQHDREEYKGPKIWMNLVRNWPIISQPLAVLIIFLLLWIMGYAQAPKYAIPETVIMRIAFLFAGAELAGILVTFMRLPDMLGMLFFGVLYTNLGLADFSGYGALELFLRELALITLMLLAGLGLDGSAFKKLWVVILRLTLVPTIVETAVICFLAHFLLDMPWFWGLLMGLVITAVSPNVVVTVMLKLKEQKLGLNNGIHTLIYATTTCNDVVAIFTFGVILGVIFNPGKLSDQILQGPVGIVVGIVYGYIFGLILVYFPSKDSKYVNGLRFTMTVLGGCVSVMGSRAMGYPSAGALGCVTLTFVAGTLWRKQQKGNENTSVTNRLDLLWKFLKPVSFSLIGKEINFSVLDGKTVGYGLIVIAIGCVFRLAVGYYSTNDGNLTTKERAYITICGFPKATVQAALGPIALDMARQLNAGQEILSLASNILVISVIAIIFTAPLGAILMIQLAPRWLKHHHDGGSNVDVAFEGGVAELDRMPAQSPDNIAIITVGDNRILTDSAHSNNGFDHGNSGR